MPFQGIGLKYYLSLTEFTLRINIVIVTFIKQCGY